MENLLPVLALLACPVGMGLMMLFMGKGMFSSKSKDQTPPGPDAMSLRELKREQARLHEHIERLEGRERHQTEGVPSGSF